MQQGDPIGGLIILFVIFAVYFLPSVCAIRRHCRGRGAIVLLNLMFG